MTTEKPAQGRHWLLEVLSPLTLHLTGIILIYLFTLVVRLRSAFLRKVIALALFNSIIFFGYLKTSSDPNLFRVLHTARTPSIKDIQMGLDRLELTMDEDTVAEMENKLTGKASSYYLKGHDLFGDEYPMLDFNEKLSVAKEAKKYRLIADHLIFFYITFMFTPVSTSRKTRLLIVLTIAAGLFLQCVLYEVMPELDDLTASAKQLIFSVPSFKDFTIFNITSLIQYAISALLLSSLLAWRLGSIDQNTLAERIDELATTKAKVDFSAEVRRLISDYKPFAEAVEQNTKLSKWINVGMIGGAVMSIGIFVLDYLEKGQPTVE